MTLYQRLKLCS